MTAQSEKLHRRSIRLPAYDFSLPGRYFVTICTQNRERLLGAIKNGEMVLNEVGKMAQAVWKDLPNRFPLVELDEYVVMPNHFHGILILNGTDDRRGESRIRPAGGGGGLQQGEHQVRPYGTLDGTVARIVQAFKSLANREYMQGVKNQGWPPFSGRLWQRNYYEHIIRSETDLRKTREYIAGNPVNWALDKENPSNFKAVRSSKIERMDHLEGMNAI
ncbi:MAG: transposase [candidate division Zixibacteria bacterium]|nr:transposase [candidate division Zixibacteria bacterium]